MNSAPPTGVRSAPQRDRRGSANRRARTTYYTGSSLGFALFLVFLLFSYLQAGIRIPLLGAIRAEFILGALLSVMSFHALSERKGGFDLTPVGKWALALIGLMGLMTVFSVDFALSWSVFLDRGVKFAMLALFITAFVTTPLRLKLFILVFLLACAKMGQEGLHGTLTGTMVWDNQGVPRLRGSTPAYAHPNSFSGVGVGALPFIFFIWPLVSLKWRVLLGFLTVAMLNIVLKTGSRAGYVAFIGGVIWIVAQARQRWKVAVMLLLVAAVAVPFIPQDYTGRFVSIFEDVEFGENSSKGKRMEILVDAWTIFLDHPLGVGVGAFPVVRQATFGRGQDTHNLYLEVGTNLGVQGLAVFSGLVIAIFSTLARVRKLATRQLGNLLALQQTQKYSGRRDTTFEAHVLDLKWIVATANAFMAFMVVRLLLGLFGMDLYERYWWFAGGSAIALWNILRVSQLRSTSFLMGQPDGIDSRIKK